MFILPYINKILCKSMNNYRIIKNEWKKKLGKGENKQLRQNKTRVCLFLEKFCFTSAMADANQCEKKLQNWLKMKKNN